MGKGSGDCQRNGPVPGLRAVSLPATTERDVGEVNPKRSTTFDSKPRYSAVVQRGKLEIYSSTEESRK